MAMAVHMRIRMDMCSPFLRLYKGVHDKVRGSQLLDFFLHGFFQDTLLGLYQTALFLVVVNAILIPPTAMPPAAPRVFAGGATIGRCIASLFAEGGAFSAGAKAAAAVTNDNDERATAE